jgi:hypothetical protein
MKHSRLRSIGIAPAIALCCATIIQPAIAATLDSCALMKQADVQAVFSPRTFDQGTAGPPQPGTAKLAAVASCTYTSQAASPRDIVSIMLLTRRAPEGVKGVTTEAMKAGVVQLKGTPVDVAGLGDGAFWANLGTDSHPSYQLNVRVGDRYWLVFSTAGVKGEPQRAIQNLTSLAKTVLPRL